MADFGFFFALVTLATCFSLIEIQIEGAHGWAAKLPTWRLDSAWIRRLFPGRALTGYHLWTLLFVAMMAHLPFAFQLPWTTYGEMRAIAFILLFWVLEDFLWFVLNPHYGLRRFRPQFIAWHRDSWWLIAPRDYWVATLIGVVLYCAARRQPEMTVVLRWN